MRLTADSLSVHLTKSYLPLYVLYGNEPFLIEESARAIRDAFLKKQAGEHHIITIENANSWSRLEQAIGSRSLFSTKQLIDLRLFDAKIQPKDALLLETVLTRAHDDLFFLIQMGTLSRAQQQAKWLILADKKGALIGHWPLTQAAFSRWITMRLNLKNIPASSELISELTYYTEGNCLAAAQEIERLALLKGDDQAASIAMDQRQNQFTVFDLMEAAKQQKPERVLSILEALRASGTAIPLLIWSFAQTVRKAPSVSHLYPSLSQLDKMFKSGQETEAWLALTSIALELAGKKLLFPQLTS